MRAIVIIVAAACALVSFHTAAVAAPSSSTRVSSLSRMAPADEYFGRLKESVLEIRNRLDALDLRSDADMAGSRRELDDLQNAIRDWQHKYPADPWLPRMTRMLMRDYERADGAG